MAAVETVFKIAAVVTGANAVDQLSKSIDKVSTSGEKMSRAVATGATALRTFAAGIAAAAVASAGQKFIEMADKSIMLEARLRQATTSSAEFQEALAGLQSQSLDTGAEVGDLLDVFQRISIVRKEINETVPQMLAFTSTVSKLGALSGTLPEAMKDGLLQLGQSLSATKLRAEEFNSIMEHMPLIGQAVADQFGVTTGQLRQLVIKGFVDSKDVFQAIQDSAEEVNKKYAEMPMTFGRAWGIMTEMLREAVAVINDNTGAMEVLGFGMKAIGVLAKGIAMAVVGVFQVLKAVVLEVAYSINEVINTLIMKPINTTLGFMNGQFNTKFSLVPEFTVKDVGAASTKALSDIGDTYNKLFDQEEYQKQHANDKSNTASATKANPALQKKYNGFLDSLNGNGKGGGAKSASERAVEASTEWLAKQREEITTLQQEIDYIGRTSIEIEKMKDARKMDTEAAEKAANLSGAARDSFLKQAEAIKQARQEVLQHNYEMQRMASTGAADFFAKYAEDASNMAEQVKNALSNAFKGAEDALVGFVTTGKLNFKSLAQSIISDLARIAIRSSITGPLASALGSAFGGGTVSPFANGGIMTSQGSMPLRAYASGGVANSPQLALFGEGRMPEAYVPLPDGRTIPVTMQGGGAGGQVNQVTVNVNMQGGDQTTANSKQANDLGKLIASTVKGILINEKRAGGLLAGA